MGNGLELMLDIQQDEYLPVWGETGEGDIIHFFQRLADLVIGHALNSVCGQVCGWFVCWWALVLIPQSVKTSC